jgi:hypothetical protein
MCSGRIQTEIRQGPLTNPVRTRTFQTSGAVFSQLSLFQLPRRIPQMRTVEVRRLGAQFRFAGFPVMAFGLVLVLFLGLPSAHAQSPIGTAESCFEAGPDHVPTFIATPVPPVRPGFPSQMRSQIPAAASVEAVRLVPAGFTPLRAQPVHMLNAGNKDRWVPALRKSPEFLASNR